MASRSQVHGQLNLGPLPLADRTQDGDARPSETRDKSERIDAVSAARANETQDSSARLNCTQAEADASELFDLTLKASGISSAEVAYLFGGISESVVNRMRSTTARERVSLAQLLLLPPSFHWHLHKAMNRRYGFSKLALREALDMVGELAMAAER